MAASFAAVGSSPSNDRRVHGLKQGAGLNQHALAAKLQAAPSRCSRPRRSARPPSLLWRLCPLGDAVGAAYLQGLQPVLNEILVCPLSMAWAEDWKP